MIIENFYQNRKPRTYQKTSPTLRGNRGGLLVSECQKSTNTPAKSLNTTSLKSKTTEMQQKLIQSNYQTLICSVEDFLANHLVLLEKGEVSRIPEAHCFLRLQEYLKLKDLNLFSLKMSKAYSITTKGKLLKSSFKRWMNWGMRFNGWCLTANFSEFPRTENGFSLSEILEERVNPKYYLSKKSVEKLIRPKNYENQLATVSEQTTQMENLMRPVVFNKIPTKKLENLTEKKCLLVEPDYKYKYPNLALMKISSYLKKLNYKTEFYRGLKPIGEEYEYIFITTLFTYYYDIVVDTINYYKINYPDSKIIIGGILASLLSDKLEKNTGIKPTVGYFKELDVMKPDYNLIDTEWDEWSFVFTTRGCPNNCSFCAVKTLEPDLWINPNWKNAVDLKKRYIMIMDNNLTSHPIEHFEEVCKFIKEHKLKVTFDNGFDANLFTERHLKAIKGLKFNSRGLRFAFDNMRVDGRIQKVIKLCLKEGIKKTHIMIYVLFNYNDTPQEAEWRAREIIKSGAIPYPQRYSPLDYLKKRPSYVGKYWTQPLARYFRFFYMCSGISSKQTFIEWLSKGKERHLIEDFNKYEWDKNINPISIRAYPRNKKRILEPQQRIEIKKDNISNSISQVAKDSMVKNCDGIRRLTPVECCRLQGFPDDWVDFGIDEDGNKVKISDTQKYKMMGNAVTVKVIKAIVNKLI